MRIKYFSDNKRKMVFMTKQTTFLFYIYKEIKTKRNNLISSLTSGFGDQDNYLSVFKKQQKTPFNFCVHT